MGVSLKNIFNEGSDDLTVNKSANAIKALIYVAIGVFVFLVIAIIIKLAPDKDKERREKITKDIQVVQSTIQVLANKHNVNPTEVPLRGSELTDHPQTVTTNGVAEEYRYGYYLLSPEEVKEMIVSLGMPSALNLEKEYYIVNYDTNDVINVTGIKFKKIEYHTIEDILLIDQGKNPPVRQVIRTAADLEKIRRNPDGIFKLSGNLDMSAYSAGQGWDPIPNFTGTLDGRGYTIENLTIARPSEEYVGLFEQISVGGRVTNLKFSNVNIQGSRYVGTVAGSNNGDISLVKVLSGTVTANTEYVGGLVGAHANRSISNCTVNLDRINGSSNIGGIAGIMYFGTIAKSGATCNAIIGKDGIGGAVGCVKVNEATYIQEVTAKFNNLTGSEDLGGLIGKIDTATDKKFSLANSYAKGTIEGTHEHGGGVIGLISCVSDASLELKDIYTVVDIVKRGRTTGGFVGYTDISMRAAMDIKDCFWRYDPEVHVEYNSVGSQAPDTFPIDFTPKKPEQMTIRSTYTNWDFDIWEMKEREDSPYLKWEVK